MLRVLVAAFATMFGGLAAAASPPAAADDASDLSSLPLHAEAMEARRVHIVYSGDRGGVASARGVPELLGHVRAAVDAGAGELARVSSVHGVVAQEPWIVRAPDHAVSSIVDFLRGDDIRCGPHEDVMAVDTGLDVLVLDWPEPPKMLGPLTTRVGPPVTYRRRSCANSAGEHAILLGPAGATGEPDWRLEAFEFRQALQGELREDDVSHPFMLVARPQSEIARTFARIEQRLKQQPLTMFVDAGNFVDGASSVRDGGLSMHRPLGFDMLARLGPTALAPGRTELVLGASHFMAELAERSLPYVATNWVTEDESLRLPTHVVREVPTNGGSVRVAFVGVLDPELMTSLPALSEDAVMISDPVLGVQPTIDQLFASPEPPDAVIALTTASPSVLADLRRGLRGVDLLLGDPSFATIRVGRRDVIVDHLPPDVEAAPVTLSLDGLATVDLSFDGPDGQLDRVENTPWLVMGEPPVDAEVQARITQVRAEVYPPLDRALIAASATNSTDAHASSVWNALLCEAVRARTAADSVLLSELPDPPASPGALSELVVTDQLALLDQLEVHNVPGDRLNRVLDKAYGTMDVSCGPSLSGSRKVWGRNIEPDRVYRLVTTDRTRRSTPLGEILESNRVSRPLDGPPSEVLLRSDGQPLTLRSAVLEQLREVRDSEGIERVVPSLVVEAPTRKPPQWLTRVRQAALQVERFRGIETDDAGVTPFATVPETLANSPSSFTLGSTGDVSVEYSDVRVSGDLRYRSAFTRIEAEAREDVDGDGVSEVVVAETETADDWLLSTTWAATGLVLVESGDFKVSPYTELRFDSEYTPLENPDFNLEDPESSSNEGIEPLLPRQADLSLALGLAARPVGSLRVLRLGAFANRALNQLEDKPTEYGGRLELETLRALGPALRWTVTGDLQVFADTAQDDETDLRFRAFGESRVALPLARFLDIAVFAQGFALQRRFDPNPRVDLPVGTTWNVGVAVQSTGAFLMRRTL